MLGKCARRARVWGSQGQRSGLGVLTQASLNLGLQFLSHRRCHHLVVGAQLPAPPNARPPLFSLRSSAVSRVEGAQQIVLSQHSGFIIPSVLDDTSSTIEQVQSKENSGEKWEDGPPSQHPM